MKRSRFAGRVGLFVAVALLIFAALVFVFMKGGGFKRTYELRLRAATVSNLKQGSLVLMAGVPIGSVSGVSLQPGGKGVILHARIEQRYQIHGDAEFRIQQLGFLGDQYVAVYPKENQAPVLPPGAEVPLAEPFDLQQTARSATALVDEVTGIVKSLKELAVRLDQKVLSEGNLTNVNVTLNNVRVASDKIITMVDGVNALVATNSTPIFVSVSNLVHFSDQLNIVATELAQLVSTNRVEFTKAINSLDNTAGVLERLAYSVEEGRGVAGAMLKDDQLKDRLATLIADLQVAASNISNYGLLFKPKKAPRAPQNPPYPGKSAVK